jgi:hypothetical protein
MNSEAVKEMLDFLEQIEREAKLMKHLKSKEPYSVLLMLAVDRKLKSLKTYQEETNLLLEMEFESINITDVMLKIYEA